jgi:hypothetical protein
MRKVIFISGYILISLICLVIYNHIYFKQLDIIIFLFIGLFIEFAVYCGFIIIDDILEIL